MKKIVGVLALLAAVLFPQYISAQEDATKPLAIFVGTSSIAKWTTLEMDFPNLRVENLGVEGSAQLPDGQMLSGVAKLVDEVIRMHPKIIVLYAGENDLWVGASPEEVHDGIKKITAKLEAALPDIRIVYVTLKPSPQRMKIRMSIIDEVIATNRLLQEDTWTDAHLRFADVFSWMLNMQGEVRLDLFTPDELHMNEAGYEIWKYVITEVLK